MGIPNRRFYNYRHGSVDAGVEEYTKEQAAKALYFLVPMDHTYTRKHYMDDYYTEEEITTNYDWCECIFEDDVKGNPETFAMYDEEIAKWGYYTDDAFCVYRND